MSNVPHVPVMVEEMLKLLQPKKDQTILDCTFGAGGYTKAILDIADCKVIAIDRDEKVRPFTENIKNTYGNRFQFLNICFSQTKDFISESSLDGIVLDLGVSSMQLDNGERGFSFNKEAPLSMAMGLNKITAHEVVNSYPSEKLADIIYTYSDESKSKKIAEAICCYRQKQAINTTLELAEIVSACYPKGYYKIHPATKTFQAIRIYVNNEVQELQTILNDSINLLKTGGRLVVITFHSLEDRIVKNFIKEKSDLNTEKLNKYKSNTQQHFVFKVLTKKPIMVSDQEVEKNVRSRSAKLRGVIRC